MLRRFFSKKEEYPMIRFEEGDGLHTRVTLDVSELKHECCGLETIDLEFEIYDMSGKLEKKWSVENISLEKPFVLDSKSFRPDFRNPKTYHLPIPYKGSLRVKPKLKASKKEGGLRVSVHYYTDDSLEGRKDDRDR